MRNDASESAGTLQAESVTRVVVFYHLNYVSTALHESSKMHRGAWLLLPVLRNHYEDVPFNELTQRKQNPPWTEISNTCRVLKHLVRCRLVCSRNGKKCLMLLEVVKAGHSSAWRNPGSGPPCQTLSGCFVCFKQKRWEKAAFWVSCGLIVALKWPWPLTNAALRTGSAVVLRKHVRHELLVNTLLASFTKKQLLRT